MTTSTTPPAANTRLKAAKLRGQLDKLSPTALIFLGLVALALVFFGIVQAVKAIQPQVQVVQGMPTGAEAPATTAPAVEVLNPLQAPQMPPVSPEARRLIKTDPADPTRLVLAVSVDIWRQMSPPFAAPGVDLCSWHLTVSRDTGHIVATPESDEGIPLFDQESPPCAPEAPGNVVGGSTAGGTIPTVTGGQGPASGPSR